MASAIVDLRSDTVTQPSAGMRAAIAEAPVGDDVYGDDPTVIALQEKLAEMSGFEGALFMPTGTQSNLVGLMTHCRRGDEYIVGQDAHTYKYEGGGAATLGSIQPQPIENAPNGTIPIEKIRAAVKPDDIHFARTRLIALENTISGKVLPEAYLRQVRALAREHDLAVHLDGARVFNAVVASNTSLKEACAHFDSVSICLSKGLGTPAGSVLCGGQSFIEEARRWRKMLGGGMRQVGMLAAAGLYALKHNVERLAEDHENARTLACALGQIDELNVLGPYTNILYVQIPGGDVAALRSHLNQLGIRATLGPTTRRVTHLDVDRNAIDRTVDAFKSYYAGSPIVA